MTDQHRRRAIHDLDVTLWVGKGGIDPVVDELREQLDERDLVKAKFLRAARGEVGLDELAGELADRSGADLVETRGHTAVFAA